MAYVGLNGHRFGGGSRLAGLACGGGCGCRSCRTSALGESYTEDEPDDGAPGEEPEPPDEPDQPDGDRGGGRGRASRRRRSVVRRRGRLFRPVRPRLSGVAGYGRPAWGAAPPGIGEEPAPRPAPPAQPPPPPPAHRPMTDAEIQERVRRAPVSNPPRMGPAEHSREAYARAYARRLDQLYRRAQMGDKSAASDLAGAIDQLLKDRAHMREVGRQLRAMRSPAAQVLRVPPEPRAPTPSPPRRWWIPPRITPRR